jgi:hypothetical protein
MNSSFNPEDYIEYCIHQSHSKFGPSSLLVHRSKLRNIILEECRDDPYFGVYSGLTCSKDILTVIIEEYRIKIPVQAGLPARF